MPANGQQRAGEGCTGRDGRPTTDREVGTRPEERSLHISVTEARSGGALTVPLLRGTELRRYVGNPPDVQGAPKEQDECIETARKRKKGVDVMRATEDRLIAPARSAVAEHPSDAPAAGTSKEQGTPVLIPAPRKPLDDSTWPLAYNPESACTAREITAAVFDGWHLGEGTTDAALLVVSELVTNAVEHAQPPVALHLHRERAGSRVWMGVSDGGPAVTEGDWTASCADDEHGRGMDIINALTAAHGCRSHSGGTTHWARLQATTA